MSNKITNFFKNIASTKSDSSGEKSLLKIIEEAFENQEFKMYLQLIIDNKSKKLASMEALSRWENSLGKVIFPGEYIDLLERTGLIIDFDYYMLDKVCSKLQSWKNTNLKDITISCNITRITISEKDFFEKVKRIADKYDFDRSNLLIEITEDCIEKNLYVAMENIIKIKELGFSIALDDIGSGYTSLISLCKYPIDVVKIDRDVLILANEEKGKKLLFGIISLAHYLNLKVVCEGVETEEQNKMITESECDYIQGWYYSKALPECKAEEIAKEYMN